MDADIAFRKYKKRESFKRLHIRARQRINELLLKSNKAISLTDFQNYLKLCCRLNINKMTLDKYLKSQLNASDMMLRPIQIYQNNP